MARQFQSISVQELIDLLQDQDPEAEICFASDYGDISHTQQAHPIRGKIEAQQLEETAYSDSGWAIVEPEHEDPEDQAFAEPSGSPILVLR